MKKVYYPIIFIVLVLVSTQPFVTQLFVPSSLWVNLFLILGYLLILYPLFIIYQLLTEKFEAGTSESNICNLELEDEISRLYLSTKDDHIFYKHFVSKPFEEVSESIRGLLGVSPDEFKNHYKRYKAELLYNGVFERVEEHISKGMRVPVYEVELRTKKGTKKSFEVIETPIFNDENELLYIWGTLHLILNQDEELDSINGKEIGMFNLVFDNVKDGILLISGDRFVDCNTRALEIFNSSLDQLLMYSPFSQKYSPVLQPTGENSKDEALRKMKLAYDGVDQEFEWLHFRQTGEQFYANVKLSKYDYEGNSYLLVILTDISERYASKSRIVEQDKLVNLLFTHSSIAILKFNSSFEVVGYNESFSEMFNDSSDLLNEDISKIFRNDDLTRMLKSSKEIVSQKEIIELFYSDSETKITKANVKLIAFEENQKYSGGMLLIEELNDLKELEISLDTQNSNFEEIISNSKDVLYKYDIKTKEYVYISSSIEDIFGYTANEIIKMSKSELKSVLHPEELPRSASILAKLVDIQKIDKDQKIEYRIINKSGVVKWIRDSYSVILDEYMKPSAILGVISDLTVQKENEVYIKQKDNLLLVMTENFSQGITVIVENKIELVNSKLVDLTGYSKNELNQIESLFIFAEEKEKERLKEDYIKVVSGSLGINELSYWFKKKSGENIFIRNEYFLDPKNPQNRYVLTNDNTDERILEYKNNPSEKLKKELEFFLKREV